MSQLRTCSTERITEFLTDRLDEAQQAEFERHLDLCEGCCQELQRRTADQSLWDDARKLLSSTDNLHVSTVETSEFKTSASTDRVNLDFLAPTDDPRMLGRIGCYEVSGVIGWGGMGLVLKAFDPALNRYAAIKVLSPHYASSGAARQRFAREAQAAAAVVHDNVVAIHGVDEFRGLPYLAMPYIKGESLQKRIDREGPLTVEETLRIAMQIARGLAAAHDQGLVHRDIKPGNILLLANVERVMITDFGLARAADDASLTRSGVIAGTPQYMSPEQARGDGIDARSDLFSLGSVIYSMCTGHPPFRAETPYGILRRITDDRARSLCAIDPRIPNWLGAIVDRLLAKAASQRYASAREVAELLEQCLAHVQQPHVARLPAPFSPPRSGTRWIGTLCLTGVMVIFAGAAIRSLTPTVPVPNPSEKVESATGDEPLLESAGASVDVTPSVDEQTLSRGALDPDPELQWEPGEDLNRLETTLQELNDEIESNIPESGKKD